MNWHVAYCPPLVSGLGAGFFPEGKPFSQYPSLVLSILKPVVTCTFHGVRSTSPETQNRPGGGSRGGWKAQDQRSYLAPKKRRYFFFGAGPASEPLLAGWPGTPPIVVPLPLPAALPPLALARVLDLPEAGPEVWCQRRRRSAAPVREARRRAFLQAGPRRRKRAT
jgi:hypothetical protein